MVEFCSSVIFSSALEAKHNIEYKNGARVPDGRWITAADADVRDVDENSSTHFEKWCSVGVFRFEASVYQGLKDLFQASQNQPDVKSREQKRSYTALREKLVSYLNSRSDGNEDVQLLGISAKPRGMFTSTFDHRSNKRTGLHVDSWDKEFWKIIGRAELVRARNRVAINLGMEPRYFIFARSPISSMLQAERAASLGPVFSSQVLVDRYLSREIRKYPVAKIEIKPGEAYIAPTENLIHDSTTFTKTHPDISLSCLGRFDIRQFVENPWGLFRLAL